MTKDKTSTDGQGKIHAILMNLSEDEQKLFSAVLTAERDMLYKLKPRGIIENLLRALTEVIR